VTDDPVVRTSGSARSPATTAEAEVLTPTCATAPHQQVSESQIWLDLTNYGEVPASEIQKSVTITKCAMDGCKGADAIVISTGMYTVEFV
jgi:UDPglucose 6-dehydrogenase